MLTALLLAGATITLPMQAECRGTEITLGEIAKIEYVRTDPGDVSDGAAEIARLEAVSLGYSPSPGFSRLLHAKRIEERVQRQAPGLRVQLVGQPACRVRPAVERLDPARLAAAAEQELVRIAAGRDVSWTLAENIQDVDVPAGTKEARIYVRRGKRELVGGPVSIPVQVEVDGMPYRTVWVTWTVDLFESVPVLLEDVPAGARLTPAMFAKQRRQVYGSGLTKALAHPQVVGSVAARDMRAGAPVTEVDVHRPIAVHIGRGVTLEVKRGPVQARVSGQALESGSVGDRVRVLVQPQQREMTGVVVARDFVRLDLDQSR